MPVPLWKRNLPGVKKVEIRSGQGFDPLIGLGARLRALPGFQGRPIGGGSGGDASRARRRRAKSAQTRRLIGAIRIHLKTENKGLESVEWPAGRFRRSEDVTASAHVAQG